MKIHKNTYWDLVLTLFEKLIRLISIFIIRHLNTENVILSEKSFVIYLLNDKGKEKIKKKFLIEHLITWISMFVSVLLVANISKLGYWSLPIFITFGYLLIILLFRFDSIKLNSIIDKSEFFQYKFMLTFEGSNLHGINDTPIINFGILFFYYNGNQDLNGLYEKISMNGTDLKILRPANPNDPLDFSLNYIPVAISADKKLYPLETPAQMKSIINSYDRSGRPISRTFHSHLSLLKNLRFNYFRDQKYQDTDLYCELGYIFISLQSPGGMSIHINQKERDEFLLNVRTGKTGKIR